MHIPLTTGDGRIIQAGNRIPAGFTVYPTGVGDALQASGYRLGNVLKFDANNKTKRLQFLNHWYGIGGRIIWNGADLSDSMSAFLRAPATGGINQAGDFNKYNLGGSFNMFVPTTPTEGAWDLNLSEVHTGTTVLKCVPVPVAGNTGFFDYDSDTNILTVNYEQKGGYNLYDFEATLFCFAANIFGLNGDGKESSLEVPDLVGKLLYNTWVIDFVLSTDKTDTIECGVIMISAMKGNV